MAIVVLGVGILERVDIVGDRRDTGACFFNDMVFEERAAAGEATSAEVEARAIVAMAGDVAEHIASGRRSHDGARGDRRDALTLLRRHSATADEARAWLALAEHRTRALIKRRPIWKAIRRLAKALVEHRRIDGARAHNIVMLALIGEVLP